MPKNKLNKIKLLLWIMVLITTPLFSKIIYFMFSHLFWIGDMTMFVTVILTMLYIGGWLVCIVEYEI